MRELVINGHRIADDEPCYVIAELGHNHQGSLETATKMITEAARCGASAVKLQKRTNADIYTDALLSQPYENENSYGSTYGAHRNALELTWDEYSACQVTAAARKVDFFATAFDEVAATFLHNLQVPAFKIASGDLTNTPLIAYVASLGKPIILSTGGGTLEDIDRAVQTVGNSVPLAILHCTASYPCAFEELNLQAIPVLRALYPHTVIGWSGHDSGIAMAVAAYTLGARIIEKHFTLNRSMKGTDHAFSLEPSGLRRLCRDLGRAQVALGDGVKRAYPSEAGPLRKMAKSLVAARDLPAGHVLARGDLARKSPAGGIPPYDCHNVVGFTLARPLHQDELLTYDHLRCEHVA